MHPGKSHMECGGAEPRPVVVSWCGATGRRMWPVTAGGAP
jgi:hypothetical protein